jgi:histidinol-phosphate/aromatic aminotransferase/cobyric acid decarboxylase-like protein
MIRYFDTPLLQNHLRISVGRPDQNDALLAALRDIVNATPRVEASRGS